MGNNSNRQKMRNAYNSIQFTIGDIRFFKNNKILPHNSALSLLQTADSCTLKITNQKMGGWDKPSTTQPSLMNTTAQ
jgi:hypothetical protein